MARYTLKCLDSKYVEEDEVILLNCIITDNNEKRILCLHRSDFCFKNPECRPPHNEMYRTAELWKGKLFIMDLQDDDKALNMSVSDRERYSRLFSKQIGDHMDEVAQGLADGNKALQRRIGDLIERDRQREPSLDVTIAEEMAIREKLKSFSVNK